jgi:anaerobic magnesium-protoporphyrin IX monomethyl ester cyclase
VKTYLVFPPHWTATEPYLSCPTLTAFLRQHGREVVQQDVNIEFFRYVLSEDFLARARDEVQQRFRHLEEKETLTLEEQERYQVYTQALLPADNAVANVERSLADYREPEKFFDLDEYYRMGRVHFAALKLLSALYHPSTFTFSEATSRYRFGSSSEVFQAVEDRDENMYIDFFEEHVVPRIEAYGPGVLGLSISSPHQIIPAFTLATMVRRRLPDVHIVIGGGYYTRMLVDPGRLAPLFDVIDSIVVYEGETALLRLVEALEGDGRLDHVPNLLWRDEEGRVRVNEPFHHERVDDLPAPTFDGFPLDDYLSQRLVIPYLTSRGCYWGKCAFCTSFETYKGGYRQRSIDLVVRDLETLSRECGSNVFFFVDQATSPASLRRISSALIDSGAEYFWQTEARFERKLDLELLEQMHRSGCRKLLFGLESGHQRVLDLMEKGNRLEDTRRILEDCQKARVGIHIFLIVGFPTETEEEAEASVDFVLGVDGLTASPGFTYHVHPFGLETDSRVGMNPERYGVTLHPMEQNLDQFLHYSGYEVERGMDPQTLEMKVAEMQARILQHVAFKDYPVHGPHNLLYLVHYGWKYPEPQDNVAQWKDLTYESLLAFVPVLADEVTVKEFKFFVPEEDGAPAQHPEQPIKLTGDRKLIQVGGHSYCYIGRTERSWLISPRGRLLLELCDGKRTVEQVCSLYEQQHPSKMAFLQATNDMRVFIQRGALTTSENTAS